MSQAFGMEAVQTQKMIMNPQMQLAMNLLRMNLQELSGYVDEELKSNPVLEAVENNNDMDFRYAEEQAEEGVFFKDGAADFGYRNYTVKTSGYDLMSESRENNTPAQSMSLKEYLKFQLNVSDIAEKNIKLGRYIIENIDERGYLTVQASDIAEDFHVPLEEVEEAIKLIQGFDPSGVGARSLKECLMLQLKAAKYDIPGLYEMINEHIEELAENKMQQISKSMGIKVQQIYRLAEIVRSLDPKPGLRYGNTYDVSYVIPDIIIESVNGVFEITVNSDTLPILNISSYYRNNALEYKDENVKRYIQSKLNSAAWIIKCIEQRKNTLAAIVKAIVFKQKDFFEKGIKYIKPMTMKEIANELKIHESTVSRAVNNKYMQCCWGVLEIKSMFSQKMYCDTGEEISASKIKNMLKDFIADENKQKPLSDSELVNMFEQAGILISRRTIAKYRGQLALPAAALRKKY